MKFIIKLYPLISSTLKSPRGILLTLTLTSLLSCSAWLATNNPAAAIPSAKQHLGDRISQLSQEDSDLPRAITRAVLRDAAKRSGVPKRNLQITQVTSKTFSNPCIFKFGEICTREYNPIKGWEIVVQVEEQSWTYHVNKSGSQIVLDPKVSVSQSATLPKEIQDEILSDAQQRSGEPIAEIKITQVTPKTFSNPCIFNFGEICTFEFNPVEGWEVVVQVRSQSWTYHVNKSGTQIVLDPKISQNQ